MNSMFHNWTDLELTEYASTIPLENNFWVTVIKDEKLGKRVGRLLWTRRSELEGQASNIKAQLDSVYDGGIGGYVDRLQILNLDRRRVLGSISDITKRQQYIKANRQDPDRYRSAIRRHRYQTERGDPTADINLWKALEEADAD